MKVAMKIRRSGMFLLALAMVLFLTPTGSAAEENVISEARNGVVRIFAYDPESGSGASGSGFGVGTAGEETEYFVTNWHVVTANGQYPVGKLDVYILLTTIAEGYENGQLSQFGFCADLPCFCLRSCILEYGRSTPGNSIRNYADTAVVQCPMDYPKGAFGGLDGRKGESKPGERKRHFPY